MLLLEATLPSLALAGLGTCTVAAVLVRLYIGWARRNAVVDVPNARSSHVRRTPRGAGLVIALLCLCALLMWNLFSGAATSGHWVLLASAAGIAVLSFYDDLHDLPSLVRLSLHLALAGAVVLWVGRFQALALPAVGTVELGVFGGLLTLLWIVGLTNVYNFMDGIDGMAGLKAVLLGGLASATGLWLGLDLLALLGVVTAASALGFLCYNWSPAKVFMGDVGSAFLGFWFAGLSLLLAAAPQGAASGGGGGEGAPLLQASLVPVIAAMALAPFLSDAGFTFLRRLVKRENVFAAHRQHAYQRLARAWGHAPVTLLYGLWTLLGIALAWLYLWGEGLLRAAVLGLALIAWACVEALAARAGRRAGA